MSQKQKNIEMQLDASVVEELRSSLRGELLVPEEDNYDEARAIWNGMIDRKPAVIVQCLGTSDVWCRL